MRNLSPAFLAALQAAQDGGIVPVRLVWVQAKDRATGLPVEVGFWSGDEDQEITVVSGSTGLPVVRLYYGAVNLDISEITYVSDLTIQTVTVSVSQIADIAQQLVREFDVRLAKVEIHEMCIDPETGQLAAMPELAFLGEVDGAPIRTPAAGGEGSIDFAVRSDAISMLTRRNSRKSSHEGQRLRSGDEWGKYSSTVATWTVPWGKSAT